MMGRLHGNSASLPSSRVEEEVLISPGATTAWRELFARLWKKLQEDFGLGIVRANLESCLGVEVAEPSHSARIWNLGSLENHYAVSEAFTPGSWKMAL